MRIAVTAATLLFTLASCSTTTHEPESPFQQPNELMAGEIDHRIAQIPFQHRQELLQNLMWLAQTGEQTIPALLTGLKNENAKVRSSSCWVLGRIRDRRTVPSLKPLINDAEQSVALEAARSLVLMGDLQPSEQLIVGLDSDRKEVRYMCHEALKTSTGHDFGYDHLNDNQQELQLAVLRWRQWWGEYSGNDYFAQSYAEQNGLGNLAAPGGETRLEDAPKPMTDPVAPTGEGQTNGQGESSTKTPQATPAPTGNAQPSTGNEQPSSGETPATTTPETGSSTQSGSSKPVIELPVIEVPSSEKPTGNGNGSGDGR